MEQEIYFLIAKFLAASPCRETSRALEEELKQYRDLLPPSAGYGRSKKPASLESLSDMYPAVTGDYLVDLLRKLVKHYSETADPTIERVNALRHGDNSLLTLRRAFTHNNNDPNERPILQLPNSLAPAQWFRANELGMVPSAIKCTPTFFSQFYKELVSVFGHRNPVYCLAFDKTNRRLFTGSDDFLVKVWCVKTGRLLHSIRGHMHVITDIAINQENTLLATASSDGYVRVWNMDGFSPVVSLKPSPTSTKPFTTIKFSPSPKAETRYLMSTNEDGLVRLWKWDKDTLQFPNPESPVTFSCKFKARDRLRCSSFNYTGTQFSVAGDDGFVYVFSTIKAEPEAENGTTSTAAQDQRPQVGRGRRRVASALFPDKSGPGQPQPVVPIAVLEGHMGSVTDLVYSHDGQKILSGSQDGTARIWKYNSRLKTWTSLVLDIKGTPNAPIVQLPSKAQHTVSQSQLVFKPYKPNSYYSSVPTRILAEELDPNDIDAHNDRYSQHTPSLQSEPTQQHTPQSTASQQIQPNTQPIDPNHNAQTSSDQVPENSIIDTPKVSMIAWSADDRWCVVATTHGNICVFFACNGEPACILKGHEGETFAMDTHPNDPNTIVSAGYDGNVIIWDIQGQQRPRCFSYPNKVFLDCKFSKDASKFAITDEDGHCTIFGLDIATNRYDQAKQWVRGQNFYSDYLPITVESDGNFIDEQTQCPPHTLPHTSIIDRQGVEYPNQKPRNHAFKPLASASTDNEDLRRLTCYEYEEDQILERKAVVLPPIDRARLTKRRKEFVRNDEEDEADANLTIPSMQYMQPAQPLLLPDDSNDEDYNDDIQAAEASESSETESASDDGAFEDPDGGADGDESDEVEDGLPKRSRRGLQSSARSSNSSEEGSRRKVTTPRRLASNRGRGRGRSRNRSSSRIESRAESSRIESRSEPRRESSRVPKSRETRSTSKRRREGGTRSEEEEDRPVRPRRRVRTGHTSYQESELENSESSEENTLTAIGEGEGEDEDDNDNDEEEEEEEEEEGANASDISEAGPSNSSSSIPKVEPEPSKVDRKGKKRLRSSAAESDEDFIVEPQKKMVKKPVTREAPKPVRVTRRTGIRGQRDESYDLTVQQIELHAPTEWIKQTNRTLSKYHPQVGDRVAIMTEGQRQYWKTSNMIACFDPKNGPITSSEPVVFATVVSIQWLVGPPVFCRLKLHVQELINTPAALFQRAQPQWQTRGHDVTIDYSDEDGKPEFIVLFERFLASMEIFQSARVGLKVDAMYDESRYTGTICSTANNGVEWKAARTPSPWAYYHVVWDDAASSPEDLSPWEFVPSGQDFQARYNVGSRLTRQEKQRAREVLGWLSSESAFELYVHQVDYYSYRNYLSVIAYPICLEMVLERVNNDFYRQKEALIDDVELIRKNAMKFNDETSPAHKNAVRMANYFKTRMLSTNKPLLFTRGPRRKITAQESDDEYHEEEGEESAESDPEVSKQSRELDEDDLDDDDDFVVNDDDDDD
ncbi:hypothetical protein CLU79DRAFT_842322 [Phycomyces nitens]|nr:hypothetical protein CLU79DRAFT_842322 [Phycomyces nitens]